MLIQQHQEWPRPQLPVLEAPKGLFPGATGGAGTAASPSETGAEGYRCSPLPCETLPRTAHHLTQLTRKGKENQLLGEKA